MTYLTFEWEEVEHANSYRLQLQQGFNISNPLLDTIVSSTELYFENLEKSKRYVWRLASIEDGNEGEFGETFHFITRHPSSVKDITNSNLISLSIEPNPVRDVAYISIHSAEPVVGKLIVFDVNGKIIQVLADRMFEAGGMSIPISANGLSTGMYNVVFITNNERIYNKLQVIR